MDSPSTSRLNGPDLLQAHSGAGALKEAAVSLPGSAAQTRPHSLLEDITSEFERTQVQNELSSELFGFAPLSFTSRVVDSANEVIYDVVDKIEVEVMKRWGSALPTGAGQEQGENRAVLLQKRADKVQKGVNRLETLLMAAVDLRFDQAEVYLLRNIFRPPVELIPYLLLPHHPPAHLLRVQAQAEAAALQAGLAGSADAPQGVKGEDEAMMRELGEAISETNRLREEILLIDTVQERLDRRTLALKRVKSGLSELLSGGGARDTLVENGKQVALVLPLYMSQLHSLLAAPALGSSLSSKPLQAASASASQPHSRADSSDPAAVRSREREDGREAWKQSREAYLQWRVHRALATSESGGDAGAAAPAVDEEMTELHRGFGKTGGSRELKALKELVEG